MRVLSAIFSRFLSPPLFDIGQPRFLRLRSHLPSGSCDTPLWWLSHHPPQRCLTPGSPAAWESINVSVRTSGGLMLTWVFPSIPSLPLYRSLSRPSTQSLDFPISALSLSISPLPIAMTRVAWTGLHLSNQCTSESHSQPRSLRFVWR